MQGRIFDFSARFSRMIFLSRDFFFMPHYLLFFNVHNPIHLYFSGIRVNYSPQIIYSTSVSKKEYRYRSMIQSEPCTFICCGDVTSYATLELGDVFLVVISNIHASEGSKIYLKPINRLLIP